MIIETLILADGTELINVPADEQTLAELGISAADIPSLIAEAKTKAAAIQTKQAVRAEIHQVAGDTKSIQGTIADSAALQLECIGKLAHALAQSSDTNVAAIAQPIASMFADFMEKVKSDEYRLTSTLKTPAVVLKDAGERSTAVNDVLAAHAATPE